MPKPAKNPALRGVIIIMSVFTALLLVGFTLLHAKLQGEVMALVITSGGMDVIKVAQQIKTPDDEEALEALAREMKIGFDLMSMYHFSRYDQFRPLAVIKIYDQNDQLIAMEKCPAGDLKRLARLESKADDNSKIRGLSNVNGLINWGSPMYRRTDIFISNWIESNYSILDLEYIPEYGYFYYTFAAEGYPILVTLQKMLPVYILTAGLLLIAIKLVKRKLTAIPITPTEDS